MSGRKGGEYRRLLAVLGSADRYSTLDSWASSPRIGTPAAARCRSLVASKTGPMCIIMRSPEGSLEVTQRFASANHVTLDRCQFTLTGAIPMSEPQRVATQLTIDRREDPDPHDVGPARGTRPAPRQRLLTLTGIDTQLTIQQSLSPSGHID